MDMQQVLSGLTAFGARWVLWVLIGLSLAGLAISIERAVVLAVSRDNVARLQRDLRRLLAGGRIDRARKLLEESPSFEARVAAAGLGVPGGAAEGAGSAEERMLGETQWARLKMERNLSFLGTLGSNAPFVGLLGTVIGIIGAFRQLDGGLGQVSSGLMAEIGEALVATAVGLLVALPAVAFYNVFHRIIKVRLGYADLLSREVLAHYKSQSEIRNCQRDGVGDSEVGLEPAE